MRSNYTNGLEEKISHYGMPKKCQSQSSLRESGYRSKSEEIVADVLEKEGIIFGYEDDLYVQVDGKKGREKRVWNPDFNLKDLGIVVEYLGKPDDKEYMDGIRKKEIVYKENGVKVVWIYPKEVWKKNGNGKFKKREDAKERILAKIYSEVRAGNEGVYKKSKVGAGSSKYGVGSDYFAGV